MIIFQSIISLYSFWVVWLVGRWSLVGVDFAKGFADCFFDDGKRLLLLIHVVEGDEERRGLSAFAIRSEQVLVQAISFPHQATQMISFDSAFEERFGRPNEHLRFLLRRLVGHAQRPRSEAFTLFVQLRNSHLSAEFVLFRKPPFHPQEYLLLIDYSPDNRR